MSSRPSGLPFSCVTNASMAADVIGIPQIIPLQPITGYEVNWTGTPTGTFTVEVSNSYAINADGSVKNAGSWNALPLSPVISPAGAPGTGFINLTGLAGYAVRLHYVRTAGVGTLNALSISKVA